jgi:hypothetical protein
MRARRTVALVLASATFGAVPASASAAEPKLTVKRSKLAGALTCHGKLERKGRPPIVFAPGTGSDGSGVYALGKGAFDALERPFCIVAFPDRTTADIQVSVQYLVYAIRKTSRAVGRRIAVAGASQGGLLARVALTYWPSLRPKVTDVVSAAAPHHGAGPEPISPVCAELGCPPAIWQQAGGSKFLTALNNGRDETPGRTSWTTVRSATDEVVGPQTGPNPTSALAGAANILIQRVCPGRTTSHLGTVVDSVTLAALGDAVRHKGPAQIERLPPDVCSHPYGTGLDEAQTSLFLMIARQLVGQGLATVPRVRHEPRVRAWVRRGT